MRRLIWVVVVLLGLVMMGVTLPGEKPYWIETPIYKILYSPVLEQPLRVEYSPQCALVDIERRGGFWTDPKYHTSDDRDYRDNVWDKGHMAPAASFNCTPEMLHMTFSYHNCALQHESLNRGVWSRLEGFERNLSIFYRVNVVIEPQFSEDSKRLETGATVPDGFWKTISWSDRVVKFYFENGPTSGRDWHEFIVEQD